MNSVGSITTVEAGKLLGISARTVCRFCDSGYIPHVKRNHKCQLWQEIKERQAAIDFIERREEIAQHPQ